MKRVVMILLLIFITVYSYCQNLPWDLRISLGFQKTNFVDEAYYDPIENSKLSTHRFTFGLNAIFPVNNHIGFDTGLDFSNTGQIYQDFNEDNYRY